MKIELRYFGILTEIAGTELEELSISGTPTFRILQQELTQTYPQLASVPLVFFSENKKMADDMELSDGMLLDCMPPFSGG